MEPKPEPTLWTAAVEKTFDDATNSYKFFWLMALVGEVSAGAGPVLALRALVARMVAEASLLLRDRFDSFGRQDRLPDLVRRLREAEGLAEDAPPEQVRSAVLRLLHAAEGLGKELASLADYVPYRFLRPFFKGRLEGAYDRSVNQRIVELASEAFLTDVPPVYRFAGDDAVELHPAWRDYLLRHAEAVRAYASAKLEEFLGGTAIPGPIFLPEPSAPAPAPRWREPALAAEERATYGAVGPRAGGSPPAGPWWRRRNGAAAKARRSWLAWLSAALRRLLRRR